MRRLIKLGVTGIATLVLLFAIGVLWFYHYSHDLPDISALSRYAPATVAQVSDGCLGQSVAIPYDSIGRNLRSALNAAEVRENDPGVLTTIYQGFTGQNRPYRATSSLQIARTMFCTPSKQLHRQVAELRTAAQIERRFARREAFTIYANRAQFGENVVGVRAAAQYLFQEDPTELDIGQASLLAGMLRAPLFYSPFKHPGRALLRRNDVIGAMIANGSISSKEGESAKASSSNVHDLAGVTTQITTPK